MTHHTNYLMQMIFGWTLIYLYQSQCQKRHGSLDDQGGMGQGGGGDGYVSAIPAQGDSGDR